MSFTDDPKEGAIVFTDGDLKRLKEGVEFCSCDCTRNTVVKNVVRDKFPALLARLEAAERCAEILQEIRDKDDEYFYKNQVEAWRARCGK